MITIVLIALCVGYCNGFRGPHHPRNDVSHHHYSPQKDIKITKDEQLLQDATHLKEDMGSMGEQLDFSNMTKEEIEFHYFKIHDIDNNAKLDGLEILYAIQHTFHENKVDDVIASNKNMRTMDYDDFPRIVGLVDRVFQEDDLDHDGYLGYDEYVLGRQRDHIAQENRNNEIERKK